LLRQPRPHLFGRLSEQVGPEQISITLQEVSEKNLKEAALHHLKEVLKLYIWSDDANITILQQRIRRQ
jgi:hypothetical protein